jgi:hypothetical protein
MIWLMHFVFPLIFAMLISGCLGSRLADVRATEPRLIGNFHVPYEQLASCTQERLEEDSLSLGQPFAPPPRIQLTHETARTLIHVYAIEGRSTLFDLTFERLYSGATLVQYRRSYEGVGSQPHAWAIVEGCAQRMRGIEQSRRDGTASNRLNKIEQHVHHTQPWQILAKSGGETSGGLLSGMHVRMGVAHLKI